MSRVTAIAAKGAGQTGKPNSDIPATACRLYTLAEAIPSLEKQKGAVYSIIIYSHVITACFKTTNLPVSLGTVGLNWLLA